MTRARGVDISIVQDRCDFAKLAGANFDFVVPKATEAAWRDPSFDRHVREARAAGLAVPLAYHVLTPHAEIDAQLGRCLDAVLPYPDLHVALDFEVGARDVTPSSCIMRALAFAQGIVNAGRKCVVYSYPYFMQQFADSPTLITLAEICEYWAADYPNGKREPQDDALSPFTPGPWHSRRPEKPWLVWQWSGNGSTGAPGIPIIVDHDVWNGTREDIDAWAKSAAG